MLLLQHSQIDACCVPHGEQPVAQRPGTVAAAAAVVVVVAVSRNGTVMLVMLVMLVVVVVVGVGGCFYGGPNGWGRFVW